MAEKIKAKNLKETEIAYQLLLVNQKMTIKELAGEIIATKALSMGDLPKIMARVHTALTKDTRFAFKGEGQWGLRDWKGEMPVQNEFSLLPSERHYQPKAQDYIWDEDEEDEDEEEELTTEEIIEPPEIE